MVGTAGQVLARFCVVTASALTLPCWISGSSVAVVPKFMLDAAAQHIGDRLRHRLCTDARDLGAGDDLERLAQDLRQRSQPETEIELARVGFRVGDEFPRRLRPGPTARSPALVGCAPAWPPARSSRAS
jgi:hypothetical protein